MLSTCPFFRLYVRSFVCYRLMYWTNEPISMQIGINLPPRQGYERSTLGARRLKVKVTGGRSYIWKPGGDIILDPLSQVKACSERRISCLWKGGVAYSFNCTPRLWDMHLADALVFPFVPSSRFPPCNLAPLLYNPVPAILPLEIWCPFSVLAFTSPPNLHNCVSVVLI